MESSNRRPGKEWDAEITEQTPDQRIAWTSRGGAINGEVVTFHRFSDARSKVMRQMEYAPQGFVENVGDALGVVSVRVQGALERFKEFIEKRGRETGAIVRIESQGVSTFVLIYLGASLTVRT